MDKAMKIVVLGGGLSTERHVSLVSATSVCKALRSLGYKAVFIDMYLGLENYDGKLEDVFNIPDGLCPKAEIAHSEPNLDEVKALRKFKSKSKLGKYVLEVCSLADCVFLGLHGVDGEDGKIQAALDLLGVPYTGSGHLGSALAMEKDFAKTVMSNYGIATPPYTDCAPCVVKTVDGGSSIGTYICRTESELKNALNDVIKYNSRYIIEKLIPGIEITVPMLGGKALTPIEIVPPDKIKGFDYVSKYQSGSEAAQEICPARISKEQENMIRSLAEKVNESLGIKVVSRTDFIIDSYGKAWCLEVNTLPGMTPNSLIPRSAKLEGLDYPHLCEKILELSIN